MKRPFTSLTLFLSLLLASGAALAQGQPATAVPLCTSVNGHVLGNGQPLAGATVALQGSRQIVITNSEGFFTVITENVPQPKLQISAAGFEPETVPITSCIEQHIELQLLPGTRIKQRGKRKGFIMKTGSAPAQ